MMLAYTMEGTSTLAYRLFLDLVPLIALFALGARSGADDEDSALGIALTVGFFLLRDLLTAFVPNPLLYLIADSLTPAFVAAIVLPRKEGNGFPVILSFSVGAALLGAMVFGLTSSGVIGAAAVAVIPGIGAAYFLGSFGSRQDQGASPRFVASFAVMVPGISLLWSALASAAFDSPLRVEIAYPLLVLLIGVSVSIKCQSYRVALLAERDFLSGAMDTLYAFVLKASKALNGKTDMALLLEYVAETLADQTRADGALVLMVDDFDDLVVSKALVGAFPPIMALPEDLPRESLAVYGWLQTITVPLGEGLIGETAQTGKASFIADASRDQRITVDPAMPVGSLIAVPFVVDDRVIGMAVVARMARAPSFEDRDFDRASLIADFAGLVVNNAFSFQDAAEKTIIDHEAKIAESIQATLRPRRLKALSGLGIAFHSESAKGVCSDYVDVVHPRKNKVFLVMGDVAGKGISAGLIMAMIRAMIHLVTNTNQGPGTVLTWINRGLTGKIDMDHFATLQILSVDLETGDCEYANAGHRPPLLWRRATGLVDTIETPSVPIGVERKTEYLSSRFSLGSGDIILFYTDGVVESVNREGRQFGIRGLTPLINKNAQLSAEAIAEKIRQELEAYSAGAHRHDDRTILVAKRAHK